MTDPKKIKTLQTLDDLNSSERDSLRKILEPPTLRQQLAMLPPNAERFIPEFEELPDELLKKASRLAAVLIPLVERSPGQMSVLLTKRSEALQKHPGEISFPGGSHDPQDRDLQHTALREAEEEVAIAQERVHIFGSLMKMPTVTGFMVTSFIGEFQPTEKLIPNPQEVEELIEVPLIDLVEPGVHNSEYKTWNNLSFLMHSFDWNGHHVWGATAHMLHDLLSVLYLQNK